MKKQLKKVITHPLFSGSAIMILGSNSANGLNYLYHIIIGRLLGPSSYGELAALISVIGLLGIIPGALTLVVVKEISSAKDEKAISILVAWFKEKMFMIALIFSVLILVLSPALSAFLHINEISYFFMISAVFLFSLQAGLNRSILQGLLKFKEFVISILLENGVKLFLSIFLIYIGLQVKGAMMAFLLSAVFGFYITNFYLKFKKSKLINLSPNISSMVKFALPVGIQTIAVTSLYTTDLILVKHFFSSHEAGIYASLSTLSKIIFYATGPIGSVMFPLIAQRKSKGENFKTIFIYSFFLTFAFSLGGLLMYGLFPRLIISFPYGSAFLGSEGLLVWFALFITLFTLSALVITYNLSLGKSKVTILPLLAAVAQIILIILFHQTLFQVILISIFVTALLLILLLIYSILDKDNLWK